MQDGMLIYGHTVRAGIDPTAPAMRHFARALFLLVRQCGAAGLARESRELFHLAKAASGSKRAAHLDFKLYSLAAGALGWTLLGRIACAADRFRK